MTFPVELTSALTGASVHQLRRWRSTGLVVPEVNAKNPPLYSFRDLILIRTVVRLRGDTSIQRIRRALQNLSLFELNDHPSAYEFGTDGKTIVVSTEDQFIDLVGRPGQMPFVSLAEIFEPFKTNDGAEVVAFHHPRLHLEVDPRRLGGWPTIEGSRVAYDTVAELLDGDDVSPEDVSHFYPTVSPEAAEDAVSFARDVASRRPGRAA